MWVLLPVKRFDIGKSRLGSALTRNQRAELAFLMLQDVLDAVRNARGIEHVRVLSNETAIDGVLHEVGIERCVEPEEGSVNRSLTRAIAALPATARRVLILAADVPMVTAGDIEALAAAQADGVVLAPATEDKGTNALLSVLPLKLPLQFGHDSLRGHLDGARALGIPACVVPRAGLARDMDRPDDLEWLARSDHGGRAAAYLRALMVEKRKETA